MSLAPSLTKQPSLTLEQIHAGTVSPIEGQSVPSESGQGGYNSKVAQLIEGAQRKNLKGMINNNQVKSNKRKLEPHQNKNQPEQ